MAKKIPELTSELTDFIRSQHVFFVGTAANEGRVNISPKGMDTFRVVSPTKIIWLNLTGSGNETAAHLLRNNRMTIMFCAFENKPMILRLYGEAKIFHNQDTEFHDHIHLFPNIPGSRQIIEMDLDLVQTSCGYAVPFMDFNEERTELKSWAEKQGEKRLIAYRQEKNAISIDNYDTGIHKAN
ncbi:pyridoxamine 5'-phosphate oxidase family protein [Aquimarina addita]|uniref:Pyridoxamine 5'-phosphate oxidase family protein n=1 Tax=Aquimarina addita TaxID=870485 RepID=A0ABP6UM94_9FLAO